MSRNAMVLSDVVRYEKLRGKFVQFIARATEMLPTGNKFGIEFGGSDPISAEISVLHHRCRAAFTVHRSPVRTMIGKIEFGRLVGSAGREETRHLLSVYFDELGNATEAPSERGWFADLNGAADITDWLAVRLLEEFLNDLAPETSPTESKP